jgi:hypothetical protein
MILIQKPYRNHRRLSSCNQVLCGSIDNEVLKPLPEFIAIVEHVDGDQIRSVL